ncbi:MAG: glycosyltransferase [Nanoarchaeota archaeon]
MSLSIIICSKDKNKLASISSNIKETSTKNVEVISIDNLIGQYSLASAYNLGARLSDTEEVVFLHEDIEFLCGGWDEIVLDHLNNQRVGMVGVVGTTKLRKNCGKFVSAGVPYVKGKIVHNLEGRRILSLFSEGSDDEDVAMVDGVFMATRKSLVERFLFDEINFNGFHFYDLDFSLRMGLSYRILVTPNILISHESRGTFDKEWKRYEKIFLTKNREILQNLYISSEFIKWKNVSY